MSDLPNWALAETSTPPTRTAEPAAPAAPSPVIARFLTLGGATVELRATRFTTHYTHQGRPYVSDTAHEVNGFTWYCHGCDDNGYNSNSLLYGETQYLPSEADRARNDANGHAGTCRAMPNPGSTP